MPQGKTEHVRVKEFLKELNSAHPEKAKEGSDTGRYTGTSDKK